MNSKSEVPFVRLFENGAAAYNLGSFANVKHEQLYFVSLIKPLKTSSGKALASHCDIFVVATARHTA